MSVTENNMRYHSYYVSRHVALYVLRSGWFRSVLYYVLLKLSDEFPYSMSGEAFMGLTFRSKLRQESCINKLKYFFLPRLLLIVFHQSRVDQLQLVMCLVSLENLLKRRPRSTSYTCKPPGYSILQASMLRAQDAWGLQSAV
jgi:hypothetical protein